jgi:general secretion pathway protein L
MHLVLAYDSQYKPNDQTVVRMWCLLDENKNVILQGVDSTPAQIAEATQNYSFSTTVLLMSPDVNVIQVTRPPGSLNKIRQALPYILEEQLVEDVENLHFTILNQLDHQSLVVAVINRTVLQDCVNALTAAKLIPETILPLWLVLPEGSLQQWRALIDDDYIWVRNGKFTGFAIELGLAEKILSSLYALQAPESIEWIIADNMPIDPVWLAECAANKISTTTRTLTTPETWLTYIAQSLPEESALNLLHSEFSIKQQIKEQKRSWKLAAGLVAGIFAVWFVGLIGQYVFYSWNLHQQNQEIENTYQKIFPGTQLIGNPRSAVDRELTRISNGGVGSDFLSLLLRTGDILQKFPQIHITQIVYANSRLDIAITTDNFSSLREVDEAFANQGLPLEQENANSTNGVVQARLIIG